MSDLRLLLLTLRDPISGELRLSGEQAKKLFEWITAVELKLRTQDDALLKLQTYIMRMRAELPTD